MDTIVSHHRLSWERLIIWLFVNTHNRHRWHIKDGSHNIVWTYTFTHRNIWHERFVNFYFKASMYL